MLGATAGSLGAVSGTVLGGCCLACCSGCCFRKPVDNKKEKLHTNLVPANLGHKAKPLLVEPVLIVK